MIQLPDPIKAVKKEGNRAVFDISPLMPGFGATVANPLRRVLLSSLEGAAIVSIKIKGVDHEYGAIAGVQEDIIQIILNLKKIRCRSYSNDPVIMTLSAKGEGAVTAADIVTSSDVDIVTPTQHICTLTDKKTTLEMELTVKKGRGYESVEELQKEKLPIGVIAIDAIYSPVRLVNFTVDDMRVGQRIDYNRVTMEVETDGTIQPEQAVKEAAGILKDHFELISAIAVPEAEAKPAKAAKPKPARAGGKVAKKAKK
ncbi:MAG TPA: DNA-directed RNA polymerase subunit alpha [Candidatus Paceibacterota bacterium]|nr:DNA-directed RNA polymerase subunit alpha [Candidatus Paceibacterota bacterium]